MDRLRRLAQRVPAWLEGFPKRSPAYKATAWTVGISIVSATLVYAPPWGIVPLISVVVWGFFFLMFSDLSK